MEKTQKIRKVSTWVDEVGTEYVVEPVAETIEKVDIGNGETLVGYLSQDTDPMSPSDWSDESGFLVHYHRDFFLKSEYCSEEELRDYLAGEVEKDSWRWYVMPVKSYIHSGVHLAIGTGGFSFDPGGWDTCHCGFVLVDKKTAKDEAEALQRAKGIVAEWNCYLSGDVWTLVIQRNDNGQFVEMLDSCGGFYGFEYAKQELGDQLKAFEEDYK